MNDLARPSRLCCFAAALALALATAPAALAGYQQGATEGASTQPRAGAAPPSALPRAGADASTAPGVEVSRNPFHPHSSAMVRQSNRLKAQGLTGHVMNDGEIVLALDSAKKLLARVEGDYQAHRARSIREAIREIDAAARQINSKAARSVSTAAAAARGAKPAPGPSTKTATSDGAAAPKSTRPQAESDAYLRQARQALVKLESHMTVDGNARRLGPARDLVQKAIQELTAAEEIR